jgi:hypothetical protein
MRRSSEKDQWLDDLVVKLVNVKSAAEDLIFTRCKAKTAGSEVFRRDSLQKWWRARSRIWLSTLDIHLTGSRRTL